MATLDYPLDETILVGEDREIEFELTDSSIIPIPIDLTSLTGLFVIFYQILGDNSDLVVGKYSRFALATYNDTDLVITDAANGMFTIKLQAEVTRTFRPRYKLFAEIKVRYNNINYSNDSYDTIERDIFIANVKKSITGKIDVMS